MITGAAFLSLIMELVYPKQIFRGFLIKGLQGKMGVNLENQQVLGYIYAGNYAVK